MGICTICDGQGWVCENHPDKPWGDGLSCPCGGAGAPCVCHPAQAAGSPMANRGADLRMKTSRTLKLAFYCRCGAGLEASVGGSKDSLDNVYQKTKAMWDDVHKGEGHGTCTRDEAVARAERPDPP